MNEKVAGAEKQVTEAEKQMQKVGKTATIGTGKQMQKTEKTATMGAGKQIWRALNYYKKRE